MFKKFVAALAALLAATAFAAVDANKATQAELEAISGIGPVISTLIVSERKKSDFKDWNDLVVRVKGVGDRSAAKFSEGGLTVNGKAYAGAPATEPAKAPMSAKAASGATRVVEATKATASKAASAVKGGAEKAASGVKGAAKVVKEDAKEQKDAVKENVADAKAKRAEKKAAKAEAKVEKAAAASAPKK
jgi:competence protein ComEA